ncbi:hypothetical protein AB0L85_01070 [Streptomyces sp. NPDC052051]|uniref:hypothetical protein n=1 Tax=Streptomyces sp. NPDC052051 TaxID=3154649 RepID=UPI00341E7C80
MASIFAKHYLNNSAESMGAISDLSVDFRLYLIAIDRMNRVGHAHFDKGELQAALPDIKSPRTIHAAISKLETAGMLAPKSNIRSLIVPTDKTAHDMNKRGAKCPRDCHGKFFHSGAWTDPIELEYGTNRDADWARSIRERAEATRAAAEAEESKALTVLRNIGGKRWWRHVQKIAH